MGRSLKLFVFWICFTIGVPSIALDFHCIANDPDGDPTTSPGKGFDGPAYQDVLWTAIDRVGNDVVFSMEVAEPIPVAPDLRTPQGTRLWMWGMNTAPGVPRGFPLSPGLTGLLEFWIHLAWDGHSFGAIVIDRRPGLSGGQPLVTEVPFTINGAVIRLTAGAELFDLPESFRWGTSTWFVPAHLGDTSLKVIDRVPDGPATDCP